MYSYGQCRMLCGIKQHCVRLLRCAVIFVLVGHRPAWTLAGDDVREPSARSAHKANATEAIPGRWVLGPITAGDAIHSIAFRGFAQSKPPGKQLRKLVVPRPLIQGAPDAIAIGEDGSQYVGGSFPGKKDFDTGQGCDFHKAVGREDGFVTCFDRNGKYRWTTTFGAKEETNVAGITVSRGVVYALCSERGGHVGILAIDSESGAPKVGFGYAGCQMFRCGLQDSAAGIQCHGGTVYVAVRCLNMLMRKLPPPAPGEEPLAIKWPSYSFTVVLAIDGTTGSAVTTFAKNGVQTIGNAVSLTGPPSAKVAETHVQPNGLTLCGSTLYVVGNCEGSSLGIGNQGMIIGDRWLRGFVAALDIRTGAAMNRFGNMGVVVMDGKVMEVNDAAALGGSLYLTGRWHDASDEGAFLSAMDADTGTFSQQFGTAGIILFQAKDWESGRSLRVNGQVVYIAGGYMNPQGEGVYVAAFDRTSGLPVKSFGTGGIRLIEGISYGDQGRIEVFGDTVFLVARTDSSLENDKHEIKIGKMTIQHGDMNGFLFRLRNDGTVVKD